MMGYCDKFGSLCLIAQMLYGYNCLMIMLLWESTTHRMRTRQLSDDSNMKMLKYLFTIKGGVQWTSSPFGGEVRISLLQIDISLRFDDISSYKLECEEVGSSYSGRSND